MNGSDTQTIPLRPSIGPVTYKGVQSGQLRYLRNAPVNFPPCFLSALTAATAPGSG